MREKGKEKDRPIASFITQADASLTDLSLTHQCVLVVDAAPISTPLAVGSFLSASNCLATQEEKDNMAGKPYRELVGVLSWLVLGSCPDIVFMMGMLACFSHNPGCTHWEAVANQLDNQLATHLMTRLFPQSQAHRKLLDNGPTWRLLLLPTMIE